MKKYRKYLLKMTMQFTCICSTMAISGCSGSIFADRESRSFEDPVVEKYSEPKVNREIENLRHSISQLESRWEILEDRTSKQDEKFVNLESKIDSGVKNVSRLAQNITSIEQANSRLVFDIQQLQKSINELYGSMEEFQRIAEASENGENNRKQQMESLKSQLDEILRSVNSSGSYKQYENGRVYVVKSGDTLSKIARENGVSIERIKEVNKLVSDDIFVEQKLIIP